MKCTIPEISWHNRDPVLSVDIQLACKNENFERLATGGTDSHVVIWHVEIQGMGAVKVEFAADLQRHQKAVNVVRFSPSGEFLASADDESAIIIWKQKTDQDAPELPLGDSDIVTKEQWLGIRVLRGHMEDVYDLSWSPDSLNLISGSVDNSAILWDVHKGRNLGLLKEHKGFVQGVAWDPQNQYVATLSSDRMCRVYNVNSKKLVSRVSKAQLPVPDSSCLHGKVVRLFHDDTLKSFFRRLCFSPDGQLLIVPSGIIEYPNSDKSSNAAFIFTRRMLNRPAVYLPSNNQYTVAVRCCPLLFELRDRESMFALPYRMILAVATQNSVLLYDTQQPEPFGIVSNIHYTRLTDLTWSGSGRMLVVSSTDGYCSIVTFAVGELGVVYEPTKETPTNKERADVDTAEIEQTEGIGNCSEQVCKETATVESSEGTNKQGFLDTQELHSNDTAVQSCAPESILDNHQICDKTSEQSPRPLVFEEAEVSSGTEEKSEYIKVPDLQKNESFRLNSCGISECLPKQEKTLRRIKPVLLSSPRKVSTKSLDSIDVSERKKEVSLVGTPKRICPTMTAASTKSLDSESMEDISDVVVVSERIPPSFSQSECCNRPPSESSNCIKLLPASDKTLINEIPSDNLTKEVSAETTGNMDAAGSADTQNRMASYDQMHTETDSVSHKNEDAAISSSEPGSIEMDSIGSVLTESRCASKCEPMEASTSATSPASPLPYSAMPGQDKRTPRRVQLITLSSPKSRKKLL